MTLPRASHPYENSCSYYVTQCAVWHVTDRPGEFALLNTLINQNGVNMITEDDYNEAMRMIEEASMR